MTQPYEVSSEEERNVRLIIEEVVDFIRVVLPKSEPIPVGSTAKGTYLPGDCDVDIFIVVNNIDNSFDLIKEELKRQNIRGFEKHGKLKIWNANWKGYDVDFVFVGNKSAETVQTIFHQQYYSRLSPEEKNEVRKLKYHLKMIGAYSADFGGATGVLCEELISRYGTSDKALEFLVSCEVPPHISDPYKKQRSLTASIDPKKWSLIKKSPSLSLTGEKLTFVRFKSLNPGYYVLTFNRKQEKSLDYQVTQRSVTSCISWLKDVEKELLDVDYFIFIEDSIYVCIRVHPIDLPTSYVRSVPIVNLRKNEFDVLIRSHPGAEVRNDIVSFSVTRKFPRVLEALINCIRSRMNMRGYV